MQRREMKNCSLEKVPEKKMNNFIIRSISGIAFTAIVILAILAGPLWYALLFFIIIALMANEYLNLTIGREKTVTKALAVTSALSLFAISFLIEYSGISYRYLLLCMIPIFAIFITNLYRKEYILYTFIQEPEKKGEARGGRVNNGYEMFPFAIAAVVYTALPFSSCNLIIFDSEGNYSAFMLLFMFIVLWMNDVGAYCIGSAFGQKGDGKRGKLFPSISPKKSWAGFFGGLASCIMAAVIMSYIDVFEISTTKAIVLGIIICIFGVWGDLTESQLKRNFGVKDSGRIIPGHGGMLDRFDAALLAFPAAIIFSLLI